MTQHDLDREVARATGETVTTIRRLGLSIVHIDEPEPYMVDWEEIDSQRSGSSRIARAGGDCRWRPNLGLEARSSQGVCRNTLPHNSFFWRCGSPRCFAKGIMCIGKRDAGPLPNAK